jgi:hypothetical protein
MVREPGKAGNRRTGVAMKKRGRGITIRLGPLGLSLLAAGITAVGLAAVSLADSDSGSGTTTNSSGTETFRAPGPGGAGVGVMRVQGPNLSAADQKKMDEFRQCMQDNGAPAPPDPSKIDPSNPPKPPSQADQQAIQKAWEACKDKLPEDLQNAGPPQIGTFKCGPPPGAPAAPDEKGQNQDQSNDSGTSSSGSSS